MPLFKNRDWYGKDFPVPFWILLIAMIAFGSIMLGDKPYLKVPTSPQGIISLELAFTPARADTIVRHWDNSVFSNQAYSNCSCGSTVYDGRTTKMPDIYKLDIAHRDVCWDFLFIVSYVLFSMLVVAKLEALYKQKRHRAGKAAVAKPWLCLLLALPIIEGLSDVMENLGMLNYIGDGLNNQLGANHAITAPIYSSFSTLKFIILAILVVYLIVRCIQCKLMTLFLFYTGRKGRQLWRYRVIVIGILLFALPIWMVAQGQDLLVNINSSDAGVIWFLFIIGIAALLNWYLTKLFFQKSYQGWIMPPLEPELKNKKQQASEKKVSRFLGMATLLIPACAILNALDTFKIHYKLDLIPPSSWLVISLALTYVILKNDLITVWYNKLSARWKNKRLIVWAVILFIGVALPIAMRYVALSINGHPIGSPGSLGFVSLDLVLMALAFLIFVSLRTEVPLDTNWRTRRIGYVAYGTALVPCLFFLFVNIRPFIFSGMPGVNFITLPLVFSGFVLYTLFFTFLIRVGMKYHINVTLILIAVALIVNIVVLNTYHDVKLTKVAKNNAPSGQAAKKDVTARNMPLKVYFANWLMTRKNEIMKDSPYPVILINTYGGGIRAAAFTSLVITSLDSAVAANDPFHHKDFEHYVLAYSGASGGTIGASVITAYRYAFINGNLKKPFDRRDWNNLYNRDYLTPVLTGLLGRDIWAASAGVAPWYDRSGLQEGIWERQLHGFDTGLNYCNDFYSYWDIDINDTPRSYNVPLLFANTTNIDDGLKGIACPVALDRKYFPANDQISEIIGDTNSIKLSTAAFLSARFPWISPAGKIGGNNHLMDGGTKENSGAETSKNIYLALNGLANDTGFTNNYHDIGTLLKLLKRIRFYFVSISNSSQSNTEPEKKASNLFQLTAPLIGLFNSGVNGNAMQADSTLRYLFNDSGRYAFVWPDVDCIQLDSKTSFSPILPLGWQISDAALERLGTSVNRDMASKEDGDKIPGYHRILGWIKHRPLPSR